ncbi:hypothetical protein OG563_36945 [Nocardia vinacea]|uniref:N-terminal of MaoC-like dehydratase domain-containing protein n=1 Tax=Nocardia vinacea TaxID=96468 RepID=A0ABZ1YR36_9NOCA|nr:hypothetical protein [Nocardia vinacea]
MKDWQAHTVVTEEYVDPVAVAALGALFESGAPPLAAGDPLPPLWHWVAFPRWPMSSAIGPDGHPARGDFLPPIELPRRMFAGGEIRLSGHLTIGSTVRRETRVLSVTPKTGRSGQLMVVEVEIRLFGDDGAPAVVERQDLIYRDADKGVNGGASPVAIEPVGRPLRRLHDWEWELRTDPTVLMRFSAVTANPHRIHYDWPYATLTEGYPGLVVHGPLMTLALAETLRIERPETTPTRVRHRNLAPLFCPNPAGIRRQDHLGTDLSIAVVSDQGGRPAVVHTVLTAEFPSLGDRFNA